MDGFVNDGYPLAVQRADFCGYLEGVLNYSPNTVRAYATDLAEFCQWMSNTGSDPLHATHRTFRRYLSSLDTAGYSRRTVNRTLSALRTFYSWLVRQGYLEQSPAEAISSPKLEKTLPRVMTAEDLAALLATADPSTPEGMRDALMLELMYATGARISELAALEPSSFDLDGRCVRLFGKGSKERVVPVYDKAFEVLASYMADARPRLLSAGEGKVTPAPHALFISKRGNAMTADALRSRFRIAATKAGVDPRYTPHTMRHTFATDVLAGGAHLRSVQELLGHASLSTTQIYTHLEPGRLRQVALQAHPRA